MNIAFKSVDIELYEGRGRAACEILAAHRREWRETEVYGRCPFSLDNLEVYEARAFTLAALSTEAVPSDTREVEARATPRLDHGHGMIAGAMWSCLAGLAHGRGDQHGAEHALERASEHYSRAGSLASAAARFQLGRLRGGAEGVALRRQAEAELRADGIVSPDRWATTVTFPIDDSGLAR
jgi:hypothetical protein